MIHQSFRQFGVVLSARLKPRPKQIYIEHWIISAILLGSVASAAFALIRV